MSQLNRPADGIVVGGILYVILGILCIVFRKATLTVITVIIGVCFLCAGIGALVINRGLGMPQGKMGMLQLDGILNLVFGLLFIIFPIALHSVLPALIAIGLILIGAFEVAGGARGRSMQSGGWNYGTAIGILTIIFGALMLAFPGILAVLLGIFLIMRGMAMIYGGEHARNLF
jgi:uncharacterized membrane protein HdeD (DUF308 family)